MNTIPMLGVCNTNDPKSFQPQFTGFLGSIPSFAMIYFDQSSAGNLFGGEGFEFAQGKTINAFGTSVIWNVPTPGANQLEAIAYGTWNSQYLKLFQGILAASPADNTPIRVRLPWEFNGSWQSQAAKDTSGAWNGPLFIAAWKVLALICKGVSPRFKIIWCPNNTTQDYNPELCWPGANYVDIVAQDFYMQKLYDKAGFFKAWFLTAPNGLAWGAAFAKSMGKPYGVTEWGMNDDMFAGDISDAAAWLKSLGGQLDHHCWWDRADGGIDCRISDGTHPGLAAAYKAAF